jgi:hypothetical protein
MAAYRGGQEPRPILPTTFSIAVAVCILLLSLRQCLLAKLVLNMLAVLAQTPFMKPCPSWSGWGSTERSKNAAVCSHQVSRLLQILYPMLRCPASLAAVASIWVRVRRTACALLACYHGHVEFSDCDARMLNRSQALCPFVA